MAIEKTQAYKTSVDRTFATLEEAQAHELFLLLAPLSGAAPLGLATDIQNKRLCALLLENTEAIVSILTTKARKPRRPNGSLKPKRARLPLAIKSDKPEAAT